jgi:hypothetical protein
VLLTAVALVVIVGGGCAPQLATPADVDQFGYPIASAVQDRDSLYLSLKNRPLEDLTDREYEYLMAHEKANASRSVKVQGGGGSTVGTAIIATLTVVGTLWALSAVSK